MAEENKPFGHPSKRVQKNDAVLNVEPTEFQTNGQNSYLPTFQTKSFTHRNKLPEECIGRNGKRNFLGSNMVRKTTPFIALQNSRRQYDVRLRWFE
jgi:hypothetical protein